MQSEKLDQKVRPKATFFRKLRAYFALTKPRVIELLLVTTVPTMVLAQASLTENQDVFPSLWLVLATLVGGALRRGLQTPSTATSTPTLTESWDAPRTDLW